MTDKQVYINDFATRSFRDYADQDYICARIAHRKVFDQQSRWCALQALEKYFKAILLYNSVSTKNLGHDISKALIRVQNIPDLDFSLPSEDTKRFVEYISNYGPDRYLSHPTHIHQDALLTLDKTVWCVRRYCFFMHQIIKDKGKEIHLFEHNKKRASNPYFETNRHKYRIMGGYLEKILDKSLPAYTDLVWKNFYYGKVKKHRIKNVTFRSGSVNPTHSMHPEIFEDLSKLVDFPKHVKNAYGS